MLLPLVESRQPEFRNLLVTSRELVQHPLRARPAIRHKIFRDAALVVERTTLDTIVPSRDTTRAAAAAAVTALDRRDDLVRRIASGRRVTAPTRTATASIERAGAGPSSAAAATGVRAITAIVTPPSYTGRPAFTLKDPARIEAMAGSRLRLQIDVASGQTQVAFNDRAQTVTARERSHGRARTRRASQFQAELLLTETGVLSIAAAPEVPRLIAVTVTPDQPPAVDIVSPGKDLLFGDNTARVAIGVRAQDDLGLRSLALRYTKVSGSGEQYEFHEGDLPLAVTRTDARQWQGQPRTHAQAAGAGRRRSARLLRRRARRTRRRRGTRGVRFVRHRNRQGGHGDRRRIRDSARRRTIRDQPERADPEDREAAREARRDAVRGVRKRDADARGRAADGPQRVPVLDGLARSCRG